VNDARQLAVIKPVEQALFTGLDNGVSAIGVKMGVPFAGGNGGD
jgi:hypothetical protein